MTNTDAWEPYRNDERPFNGIEMVLAGLQKNSFIDYPGKIACVLFTTGCNFVCPYCHNPDLARGAYPERIDTEDVMAFLRARHGMLEGVAITGGEPTLYRDIFGLCEAVKALGYPVKLDTNGSHPEILRGLLEARLVDYVAMDIKAPLSAYAPFSPTPDMAERLAASIQVLLSLAPAHEFRTTCVSPFVDADAIQAIAGTIAGAKRYVLQAYNRQAMCLDPEFGRHHHPAVHGQTLEKWAALARRCVEHCTVRA